MKRKRISILLSVAVVSMALSACGVVMPESTDDSQVSEAVSQSASEAAGGTEPDTQSGAESEAESETESETDTAVESEADTTATANIEPAYQEIIDTVANYIYSPDEDYGNEEGEIGIVESLSMIPYDQRAEYLGYTQIDLDGNGVKELLIAEKEGTGASRVIEIYTINGDTPVLVREAFYRDSLYLLEDNVLLNEGSGGAAYSVVAYYKLEGDRLVTDNCYFTDFKDKNDESTWGWFHDTTGECNVKKAEPVKDSEDPFEKANESLLKAKKLELTSFVFADN